MANRSSSSSSGPSGRSSETSLPDARDAFQFAGSALEYQQQMLRLTAVAADAMRLILRQTQRQIEYVKALSHCRDFASMGALTSEFAEKMSKEVSAEWQEVSRLSERWLATASEGNQRMTETFEAARQRTGSAH